jgi:hypothetical protein
MNSRIGITKPKLTKNNVTFPIVTTLISYGLLIEIKHNEFVWK